MRMDFDMFTGTQRILTPSEYAALGYVLKDDVVFDTDAYSSFGIDTNPFDFAYRVDTKEEAIIDIILWTGKIALAYATGGVSAAANTTWTTTSRHLTGN